MPGPDLLERFDPLTHAVGSWSLARARAGAWAAARLLWAVRDRPQAYRDCAQGLDRAVGLLSHALLAPRSTPLLQSSGSSTGAIWS